MERVWRRVQSSGRRADAYKQASPSAGIVANAGYEASICQMQKKTKEQLRLRRSRGPQTITCDCQMQPCSVHPVLIRVRKSQRLPPPNCECPIESQPCAHAGRPAGPRRPRRYVRIAMNLCFYHKRNIFFPSVKFAVIHLLTALYDTLPVILTT